MAYAQQIASRLLPASVNVGDTLGELEIVTPALDSKPTVSDCHPLVGALTSAGKQNSQTSTRWESQPRRIFGNRAFSAWEPLGAAHNNFPAASDGTNRHLPGK